ncbi:hypothetical protein SP41_78 [Salmonella phage 41]|nr:hypothetical protein SP41_78 [Salmonella phage 41]
MAQEFVTIAVGGGRCGRFFKWLKGLLWFESMKLLVTIGEQVTPLQ